MPSWIKIQILQKWQETQQIQEKLRIARLCNNDKSVIHLPRQCLRDGAKSLILLEFLDENVEFTPYLHLWKIGSVFKTYGNYKGWNIPENAEKPERTNKRKEEQITLLDILKEQKASNYSGGIYH